jgi:hypothetical protein
VARRSFFKRNLVFATATFHDRDLWLLFLDINLELCLDSCREPDIRRIIRQRLAPDFAGNRIRQAIYLSVPGLPRHNPDGGLSVPSVGAVSFGANAAKSNVVGRYEPFRQMVGELCMVTQVPEVLLTRGLGLMRSLRPFFYQA